MPDLNASWMPRAAWERLVRGEDCPLCAAASSDAPVDAYGVTVADLALSRLRLAANQYVPGYCVLICRTHVAEPYQLSAPDSQQFWADLLLASQAIAAVYQPIKMNYQILGNAVPHLHAHLVPRYYGDPAPGQPIDPGAATVAMAATELAERAARLRTALGQRGVRLQRSMDETRSNPTPASMIPHGGTAPVEPATNDVALLFAARDGDAALVGELLAAGADVDTVNNHGNTPLIMAAQHGSPETIVSLLAWHPAVDASNGIGNRALHYAAYNGHVTAVELVTSAGADVNAHNHRGNTPLINATYSGHIAVVELLLAAHAAVNQGDEDDRTALIWAAIRGQSEIARRLLAGGADRAARDQLGNTALAWAGVMRRPQLAAVLQSGA